MKLLFDQNLSFKLCEQIADIFPQSDHVGQLGLAQADDRKIWQFAKLNGYVIVSQDADFPDLAILYGPPPKVIWLRAGNRPSSAIAMLLRDHAEAILSLDINDEVCLEIY